MAKMVVFWAFLTVEAFSTVLSKHNTPNANPNVLYSSKPRKRWVKVFSDNNIFFGKNIIYQFFLHPRELIRIPLRLDRR